MRFLPGVRGTFSITACTAYDVVLFGYRTAQPRARPAVRRGRADHDHVQRRRRGHRQRAEHGDPVLGGHPDQAILIASGSSCGVGDSDEVHRRRARRTDRRSACASRPTIATPTASRTRSTAARIPSARRRTVARRRMPTATASPIARTAAERARRRAERAARPTWTATASRTRATPAFRVRDQPGRLPGPGQGRDPERGGPVPDRRRASRPDGSPRHGPASRIGLDKCRTMPGNGSDGCPQPLGARFPIAGSAFPTATKVLRLQVSAPKGATVRAAL